MRRFLILVLLAAMLSTAAAAPQTSHHSPAKPPASVFPNIPDPSRQGGDTIADAMELPNLPFTVEGTTTGFVDDYDEACPYEGSTSPDAVYRFTLPAEMSVDIDMLGSAYDTKIYLYDAALTLVACNDDFYPDYVSKLENVPLDGGQEYHLVIDGYGGEHGDYVLAMDEYEPCVLELPPGSVPEGEPPLTVDYEDGYNGGCNSPEFGYPFQEIRGSAGGDLILSGVSGWYLNGGAPHRDTDWFHVFIGAGGQVDIEVDAEWRVWVFEMYLDCNVAAVVQNIAAGPCNPGLMEIPGNPGSYARIWAGPTTFEAPGGVDVLEFDYAIHFTGLEAAVATKTTTWTTIKTLFR